MLGRQALERLAEELIGLCDRVEKHGLVDYQMGIAEDEIIERKSELLFLAKVSSTLTVI